MSVAADVVAGMPSWVVAVGILTFQVIAFVVVLHGDNWERICNSRIVRLHEAVWNDIRSLTVEPLQRALVRHGWMRRPR